MGGGQGGGRGLSAKKLKYVGGVVGRICRGGRQKNKNMWGGVVDNFFHSAPLRISNGIALTDLSLLMDGQTTGCYQIYYLPASLKLRGR